MSTNSVTNWSCPRCTYFNDITTEMCDMCGYCDTSKQEHKEPIHSIQTDAELAHKLQAQFNAADQSRHSTNSNSLEPRLSKPKNQKPLQIKWLSRCVGSAKRDFISGAVYRSQTGNEYLICALDDDGGIHSYDICNNSWKHYANYPRNIKSNNMSASIAIHNETDQLFLFPSGRNDGNYAILDLISQQWRVKNKCENKYGTNNHQSLHLPFTTCIGSEIHLIGICAKTFKMKHLISSISQYGNESSFQEISNDVLSSLSDDNYMRYKYPTKCIYNPMLNKLLIMYPFLDQTRCIWCCDLMTKEWSKCPTKLPWKNPSHSQMFFISFEYICIVLYYRPELDIMEVECLDLTQYKWYKMNTTLIKIYENEVSRMNKYSSICYVGKTYKEYECLDIGRVNLLQHYTGISNNNGIGESFHFGFDINYLIPNKLKKKCVNRYELLIQGYGGCMRYNNFDLVRLICKYYSHWCSIV